MPRLLRTLPILVLLLPAALDAQPPLQPAPIVEQVEWQPSIETVWGSARYDPPVTTGEAVLTTVGATAALGAVAVASAAMFAINFQGAGPGPHSGLLTTVLVTVGGALATPAGAHLANRRRGDYSTGVLATTLAMVVTGGALGLIASQADVPGAFLIVVPVSMIGAATAAEIVTTR